MSERPFVKICGLTRREDAQLAAELGADALGFVFYPPSPRAIAPEAVKAISAALDASLADKLWKVGVFVNSDYETLARTAETAGLSHLQLHGDEPPALVERLSAAGYQVIKALRLKAQTDLDKLQAYDCRLLIDAAVPGIWGGSGQLADWELAAKAAQEHALLLAGGLTPANVSAAIDSVRPWGLDLSSGVEAAPGIKDPHLLQALFQALNETKASDKSTTHANSDRP